MNYCDKTKTLVWKEIVFPVGQLAFGTDVDILELWFLSIVYADPRFHCKMNVLNQKLNFFR